MKECIKNRVHELYWNDDINCARTAIICLGELFEIAIEQQTIWSAVGLHGAGGYRAQCGIVEGTLMFIGMIEMDITGIAKSHHASIAEIGKASSGKEWKLSDSLREKIA
jgi:hypothetical protein|nr:hypothetical protein [uncultured Acetatifactor sp.]